MDRERLVQLFFFGLMAVMAYELYEVLEPFFEPIAWAILLAFLFHPLFIRLHRLVRSKSVAAVLLTCAVTLLVVMPAVWLLGRLTSEAQSLYAALPDMIRHDATGKFGNWLLETRPAVMLGRFLAHRGISLEHGLRAFAIDTAKLVSDYVVAHASYVAGHIVSAIVAFGIMILTFFYLLRDGDSYYTSLREITPLHEDDKRAVFDSLRATLSAVMRGLMLAALLQGVLIGSGYLVCGVSYWVVLAILTAGCGLLPIGGTALVWIPVAIYLFYNGGWGWAAGLIVWSSITVAIIDNFIKPMTVRRGTGLPTLVLFFGIAGGLELYGPIGLFAGPAVIGVFAALLRTYRRNYGYGARRAA